MKMYKSPKLSSYKNQDFLEIIGPTQTQSVSVGGGRQAMLNYERIEFRKEAVYPQTRLAKIEIKNKNIV